MTLNFGVNCPFNYCTKTLLAGYLEGREEKWPTAANRKHGLEEKGEPGVMTLILFLFFCSSRY